MKKPDPKFGHWKSVVATMDTYMKNAVSRKGVDRYKKFYNNDYADALNLKKPLKIVRVNEVYAWVRTSVSSLFARNPKFKCNPYGKNDIIPAKIAEEALNEEWTSKCIKRQIKKAIKEAKLVGYSWIKVGYQADIQEYESDSKGEVNQYIESEEVYAIHVKHDRVVYDPEAEDPPYDARWMYHWYLRPVEWIRAKYKVEVESTQSVNYLNDAKQENVKKEHAKIYEIWDKDSGNVYLYCDGYPLDFLEVKKPVKKGVIGPYEDQGFPFVMLTFDTLVNFDEKDNLPAPEISAFEDQILEKMRYRSIVAEHVKRFSRQLFAKQGAFKDNTEKEKFLEGITAAVIEVNDEPAKAVWAAPYPQAQLDVWPLEAKADMDRDRISGLPSLSYGVSAPTATRTVGELDKISEGASGRQGEQQDCVEECVREVAVKMLSRMAQFYDTERFARISGSIDMPIYSILERKGMVDGMTIKYTRELLKGNYGIEVVPGSSLPLDKQRRLNSLLSVARFGPSFGFSPNNMASLQLGKSIMEELELKDVSAAFDLDVARILQPPPPDPQKELKTRKMAQDIERGAIDSELKKTRVQGNNLSNLNKAMKNADDLDGKNDKQAKP